MALSDFTVPGEKVGPVEVAQPGENTFEYEGTIMSCVLGIPILNRRSRQISIKAVKKVLVPKEGDKIAARVANVQGTFATVDILIISNKISNSNFVGLLYISRVSRRRVRTMNDVARPGDLITATVVGVNNGMVYLSTSDSADGVFLGYCSKCGEILVLDERGRLSCPSCGTKEFRKVSTNYGKFEVKF